MVTLTVLSFVIMAIFFCGQVLYTHQKTKKAKTWQDGTLKVLATGTKVGTA